jgi:hypothetical protein
MSVKDWKKIIERHEPEPDQFKGEFLSGLLASQMLSSEGLSIYSAQKSTSTQEKS